MTVGDGGFRYGRIVCNRTAALRLIVNLRRGKPEGKVSVAYDYDSSEDWFSHNIPQFEPFLGHLKGKPCRLLEIGTYEGRSALWLAENIATHPLSSVETGR